MEERKIVEDGTAAEAAGGFAGTAGVCDICGAEASTEKYDITLKFMDGNEYLGYKKVCMKCRNSHLSAYISKNYPGRTLKMLYMTGPY